MILWLDAFELSTTTAINARYDSSGGLGGIITGRTNQGVNLGSNGFTKFVSASSTIYVGAAIQVNFSDLEFLRLSDVNGVTHLTFLMDGTSTIKVYRGSSSGTFLGTTPVITGGIWIYFEVKTVIDDTVGSIEIRINETPVLTLSGIDTRNAGVASIAQVSWNSRTRGNGSSNFIMDDFYIADDNAPKPVGGFLGNTKIEHRAPSANGTTNNFTPSTGSNYQNVDENPQNGDTDYNYSPNVNDIDLYALQDMAASSGQIRGVQVSMVVRKDDALPRSVATVIRVASTNYVGDTQVISNSYIHYFQRYGQSPNTSVAWTFSEINALEAGIKVIA